MSAIRGDLLLSFRLARITAPEPQPHQGTIEETDAAAPKPWLVPPDVLSTGWSSRRQQGAHAKSTQAKNRCRVNLPTATGKA